MLDLYMDEAEAPMFLSSFFKSPPRNFHNTEQVEFDIVRDDEDIAVVIPDITADGRYNESSTYTNKAFTPPVFSEIGTLSSFELIKRQPGANPFENPDFAANAVEESFMIARKLERKIRRSIELMASQVFQNSGTIALVDSSGTTLYSLDFQPKTTHFVTTSNTWATTATATPLADIESLANVIRRDGRKNPNKLIFGKTAWSYFKVHSSVTSAMDVRRIEFGAIQPQNKGLGAVLQGKIWIGQYEYEMWTYDGFYKHPQTGVITNYVGDDKVIMLSEGARLDLTYGGIPRAVPPDPRLSFLPQRMSSTALGLDLNMFPYATPDGKHIKLDVSSRPLTIPTAIDSFGCLDVVP